jgi:hypothetical protein
MTNMTRDRGGKNDANLDLVLGLGLTEDPPPGRTFGDSCDNLIARDNMATGAFAMGFRRLLLPELPGSCCRFFIFGA